MIRFSNDHNLEKTLRNVEQFCLLDDRLKRKVIPALVMAFLDRGAILTVTSVLRDNSSDHRDGRAIDCRVWNLSEMDRHSLVSEMQSLFPVDLPIRPVIRYYNRETTSPKYPQGFPPHFHCRVPKDTSINWSVNVA